ncbi:MAG TPA: hypothetical protein VFV38_43330 [Ktedonobacteraceae bacterium]|nr:hypothetical protein [Ktedonobacteraceae bacterium]
MNNPEENPIPAFIQELAAFFKQQQQATEETLRQNYALHESHLAFLESALTHIQADQPEEAEAVLLRFSSKEELRLTEQARLQAALGRQERSPHQERQETLLRHLSEAIQQQKRTGGQEDPM